MGKKVKIIVAKTIFCCDENWSVLRDSAVVFDEKIVEFGDAKEILKKYNLPDIDLDRLIDEKDLEEELNKND